MSISAGIQSSSIQSSAGIVERELMKRFVAAVPRLYIVS